MSLFGPVILQLSTQDRARMERLVTASERTSVALDAIVAKLHEPPPDVIDEAQVQGVIDALVAQLRTRNTETAAEVKRIADELFPPAVPPSA